VALKRTGNSSVERWLLGREVAHQEERRLIRRRGGSSGGDVKGEEVAQRRRGGFRRRGGSMVTHLTAKQSLWLKSGSSPAHCKLCQSLGWLNPGMAQYHVLASEGRQKNKKKKKTLKIYIENKKGQYKCLVLLELSPFCHR
jgi:hypothetical protein